MLALQIRRAKRTASLSDVVIATSTSPSDEAIVNLASQEGCQVVQGSEHDVLERFLDVCSEYTPLTVTRLTGDCPLVSPEIVDGVNALYFSACCDYASNTLEPTLPDGLDVEVVSVEALRKLSAMKLDADEREHVTLGIYRRPEQFRLCKFRTDLDLSSMRWTVDTPDDLEFVRWVVSHFRGREVEFEWCEVAELLSRNPDRSRTSVHGVRNEALSGLNTGAMVLK